MGELGPLEVVGPGLSDRPGNRLPGAVTVEGGLEVYRLNKQGERGESRPQEVQRPQVHTLGTENWLRWTRRGPVAQERHLVLLTGEQRSGVAQGSRRGLEGSMRQALLMVM